jgi:hypothetical protein
VISLVCASAGAAPSIAATAAAARWVFLILFLPKIRFSSSHNGWQVRAFLAHA